MLRGIDLYKGPIKKEPCVELCFMCLEGQPCETHPDAHCVSNQVSCFVDDDFTLVGSVANVQGMEEKHTEAHGGYKVFSEQVDSGTDTTATSFSDDNQFTRTYIKKMVVDSRKLKENDRYKQQNEIAFAPRKKFARFREKRFICDVCDAAFTLKQNVATHLFLYHVNSDGTMKNLLKKVYKCQLCDEVFRTTNAADKHYKKSHAKKAEKLPSDCEECGKSFASAFQLREHIVIQHLKEKNFQCEECDQKFGRRGGLRRHVQMVHKNRLYMCPYEDCDHPGYKCSKALTAHIRSVHTNVRPFECTQCPKAFVRKNDLKMHLLTHSKEQFQCDCGSKFRRQMYLKKHQKTCEAAMTGESTEKMIM